MLALTILICIGAEVCFVFMRFAGIQQMLHARFPRLCFRQAIRWHSKIALSLWFDNGCPENMYYRWGLAALALKMLICIVGL